MWLTDYLFLNILVVNNCCLSLSVTIAQLKIDWDIGAVLEFLQIPEWEACIIKEQPWRSGSGLSPGKPGFDSAGIITAVMHPRNVPLRLWTRVSHCDKTSAEHLKATLIKVNVKVVSICIAPIHETSLKSFRYSTHCQGISQVYLHTLRFIRKRNEPYLHCLPSCSWHSFTGPGGMEGWVDLGVK